MADISVSYGRSAGRTQAHQVAEALRGAGYGCGATTSWSRTRVQ